MRMGYKLSIFIVMLALLWGCKDYFAELQPHQESQKMIHQCESQNIEKTPVNIVLGNVAGASRSIAPSHLDQTALANYTLELSGFSDMGGQLAPRNFTLNNGAGVVLLAPGNWRLQLVAKNNNTQILGGETALEVKNLPTSAYITLQPLTGTGTVQVDFTLSESVVSKLDPVSDTDANREIRVALYDDTQNVPVAGTDQVFRIAGADTINYTANGRDIASGRYTLRLEADYTIQNSSTKNMIVEYKWGWSDILYVEAGRVSSKTVSFQSAGVEMGVPSNPYRRNLTSAGGSAGSPNFTQTTNSPTWGESLWLYGTYWDAGDGAPDGNEVLIVAWDPVYDADYYELELLVHPFQKVSNEPTTPGGKFPKVITNDADWENLKNQKFNYNGQDSEPHYLRFSGGEGDPDHYRQRTYAITSLDSNNRIGTFYTCADKAVARSAFVDGGAFSGANNGSYRVVSSTCVFDTYGMYTYGGRNIGKVGLEAECGVLGILMPAFVPKMAVVFRVRAVNRFGYSDWVYWKGGKW